MRALGLTALLLAATTTLASAEGASVPLGDFEHDATLPIEIASDALEVDRGANTAVFTGGVRVAQGVLRLGADRLEVFYAAAATEPAAEAAAARGGGIERLLALGNVTLTNGVEHAEAERASYVVATGIVEMDGDVLLTQGPNALAGEKLRLDLAAGTGVMEGRVQTIIVPGAAPGAGQ